MKNLKKSGLDPNNFLQSGKYIGGHPKLLQPFEGTYLYPKSNVLKLYKNNLSALKEFVINIEPSEITNIEAEDVSTIESRVGFKRMLAIGIFAFAFKKKTKTEAAYLIISIRDEKGFDHEVYFEFEFKGAFLHATNIRSKLISTLDIKKS